MQVQILTRAPALGPVEVEQFVTFPSKASLNGLPALRELRSISRYGLSAVTAIFDDRTDIYRARQFVAERLAQAMERIPAEYGRPVMGPLTTGLGEVYQFTVKGEGFGPMALRTLLQWDIGMKLRAVPGVVEVNIWGGDPQRFHVIVDPSKLLSFQIVHEAVFDAFAAQQRHRRRRVYRTPARTTVDPRRSTGNTAQRSGPDRGSPRPGGVPHLYC